MSSASESPAACIWGSARRTRSRPWGVAVSSSIVAAGLASNQPRERSIRVCEDVPYQNTISEPDEDGTLITRTETLYRNECRDQSVPLTPGEQGQLAVSNDLSNSAQNAMREISTAETRVVVKPGAFANMIMTAGLSI